MIICMMNDNFYRSSGSAIAIRRISEALSNVEYFVAGTGDRLPEDLSWMPQGRYERFDLKTYNIFHLSAELRRFRSWFRQQRCDLVHCHHRRLAVLLQLARVPVLYTGQNAFPPASWFRWLHPKQMTAITTSVATNLRANTGVEVLAVIGNPTLFPDKPPLIDIPSVRNRAVCVARLDPIKGHVHLLAAWKQLAIRGHQYQLDLIGEGPLRDELEAQTVRDGTQHLVCFYGFADKPTEYIERSLFAILVSESEGQGIVTLEAAAAGRPSLLTAVDGSIDLIPPDGTLRNKVSFGDIQEIADAIEIWFANPEEVIMEGRRFFHFLKHSSDPTTIANKYVEIYRGLITRQRDKSQGDLAPPHESVKADR